MTTGTAGHDPAVTPDACPRTRQGVAAVEIDGEVVLLDGNGHVHLLNPIASLLWACFDGQGSIGEIAADAADAFGVPFSEVQPEILALTQDLVARELVDIDHGESPPPAQPTIPAVGDQAVVVQPGGY